MFGIYKQVPTLRNVIVNVCINILSFGPQCHKAKKEELNGI